MLGAVRRYGVAHALRASTPRSLSVRATPQLLKWQSAPASRLPSAARLLHNALPSRSSASAAVQEDAPVSSEEPLREFADLQKQGLVDPTIIRTITRNMGITTMTDVQSQTLRETLKGDDVLAQAKTGTGKTLAFVVPVLQSLMNSRVPFEASRRDTEIRGLIISPTRELAEQIAVQARILADGTGLVVQTAVGGSGKAEGLRNIRRHGCDLLVGTPGRLQDVLSDPYSGIKTSNLSAFVLDEADRLLDDGFAPEIMKIQDLLPNPMKVDRQTLMFSATVPREVMHMVRSTMKPRFNFVKTVRDDEVPTHLSVPQKVVQLHGLANALPATLEIARNYHAQAKQNPELRPFKAIVYYNTTAEVNVAYDAVRRVDRSVDRQRLLGSTYFYFMHSRLTQAQRTRNADSFRQSRSSILLSSDVTARGMDFPDVTHVIQVGRPRDRDSYIHRLGRTARANKTGEGWVLLPPEQMSSFNEILRDLPIEQDSKSLVTPTVDMSRQGGPPEAMEIIDRVNRGMANVDPQTKRDAYMSQLNGAGFAGLGKRRHMESLNTLAIHGYQMPEPPSLSPLLAEKLGLRGVPGVNIGYSPSFSDMVGGDGKMSGGGFGSRRGGFSGRDRNSFQGGSRSPWSGRGMQRGRGGGGMSRFGDRDEFDGRRSMFPGQRDDRRRGGLF